MSDVHFQKLQKKERIYKQRSAKYFSSQTPVCLGNGFQNSGQQNPYLNSSKRATEQGRDQVRIQDFGQGGPAEFWPQGGALSQKFAQNGGFSL